MVFLAWLAVQAFYRALTGREGLKTAGGRESSVAGVMLATLAVTVLNPQVYLDTLLLIPAVGAQQQSSTAFLIGAVSASVLWFSLLAWGGAALSPWLSRPVVWRIIDGGIGVMMAVMAIGLFEGSGLGVA